MSRFRVLAVVGAAGVSATLVACSQNVSGGGQGQAATAAAPSPAASTPAAAPASAQAGPLSLAAVNGAQFSSGQAAGGGDNNSDVASQGKAPDPTLIKAEVLLDRANFAPGVIDGRMGENVKNALVAYDKAHDLPASTTLSPQTWAALSADKAPVLKTYTITPTDVAGPWTPDIGEDFVKMAALPQLGYSSPAEMLAERFHMDQTLLKTLNPSADFAKAGTQITVVDPGQATLGKVASLDVNKATKSVTALDESGKVVAVFPATVGSTERPSPKGTWKVKGVAQNPDYTYDPSKLTWGPKKAGKLHLAPGPHNPVGVVWIALTAPDYGIHGTPDAHLVGKTASHGCVRLTNWDAEELSKAVRPGVKVTFVTG